MNSNNLIPKGCYVFPASPGQERLWFLQRLDKNLGAVYNIATAYRLYSVIDPVALQRSVNILVNRHEILRTSLILHEGSLKQVITPSLYKTASMVDFRRENNGNSDEFIKRKMQHEVSKPFNLSSPGLFRIISYRLDSSISYLLVILHHSIADGRSMELFIEELFSNYENINSGKEVRIESPAIQFADISEWNRDWYDSSEYTQYQLYWEKKLAGIPYSINLPTQHKSVELTSDSFLGGSEWFAIDPDLSTEIAKLARNTATTDYAVLFSAFSLLLYLCSGQSDFSIGTPVENRFKKEMRSVIGFFANTVVLRITINQDHTLREILKQIHQTISEAVSFQRFPYRHLHEALQPERHGGSNSLFRVMFGFQEFNGSLSKLDGNKIEEISINTKFSRFDISLFGFKDSNSIKGFFEYSSSAFTNNQISRFVKYFKIICENFISSIDTKLVNIDFFKDLKMDNSDISEVTPEYLKTIDEKITSFLLCKDIDINKVKEIKIIDKRGKTLPLDITGNLSIDGKKTDIQSRINSNGYLEIIEDFTRDAYTEEKYEEKFIAPRSTTELELEQCWKNILNTAEKISINTSFFSIGGHSMLVAKMVDLIEERFSVVIPIKDIFFNPTIEHLAKKIEILKSDNEKNYPGKQLDSNSKQEYLKILDEFI